MHLCMQDVYVVAKTSVFHDPGLGGMQGGNGERNTDNYNCMTERKKKSEGDKN